MDIDVAREHSASSVPSQGRTMFITGGIGSALSAVRRRYLLAIFTFVVVLGLGLFATILLERKYTATALVVVDSSTSRLLEFGSAISSGPDDPNLIGTQVELARSPRVLSAVGEDLGLARDDEFRYRPSIVNRALVVLGLGAVAPPDNAPLAPGERDAQRSAIVENLDRALNIRRRGVTNVIAISAQSASPTKAADLATAVATRYVDLQTQARSEAAKSAALILAAQVAVLEQSIRQSEKNLDGFIDSSATRYGRPDQVDAINSLRTQIEREGSLAEQQRLEAGRLTRFLETGDLADLSASPTIPGLAPLLQRRANLLAESGGDDLDQRLASIDADLHAAATRLKDEVESGTSAARSRQSELRTQLQGAVGDITLPNDATVQLYTIQREARSARELYDASLNRLRQLEQQAAISVSDVRVVSPAMVPIRISFPPVNILFGLSFLLAIAAACGAAILREHVIGGITSADQVEAILGEHVLVTVPRYSPPDGGAVHALSVAPLSAYAESIRKLKLSIESHLDFPRQMTLMITSTHPDEGKTTIALSLSEAFEDAGRKVLLIDADMRRPSLHAMLGIEPKVALVDVLTGSADAVSALTPIDRREGGVRFALLGRDRVNIPTDRLLDSDRFTNLLSIVQKQFDVIIIDTPPVGLVVDGLVMSRQVDMVGYVVRWGRTNQRDISAGLRDLQTYGASNVGVVLNQSEESSLIMSGPYYQHD